MFFIERNESLVKKVVIVDIGNWDREYLVEVATFETYEKAKEISDVWENSFIIAEEEIRKAA